MGFGAVRPATYRQAESHSADLIAGIDEEFGVLLSDKEIRSMTKVGDILVLLEQKGKLH